MRMSKALRERLESVLRRMVSERPYCCPDAENDLVKLLGYGIDADGEQVLIEEWYKP